MGMRVKILGAGSAGTHLTYACRQQGWDVCLQDAKPEALERVRAELYPRRYGFWDEKIALGNPSGNFDAVFIATPPESHLALALAELAKEPKVLLLEKPFCLPNDPLRADFLAAVRQSKTKVLVGYNLNFTPNTKKVEALLKEGCIGKVRRLDVEIRENIDYLLQAHWWIPNLSQTYLGFSQRGGGSCLEHSHAAGLWLHFARVLGQGRVTSVVADMVMEDKHDAMASLLVRTEGGLCGQIYTDFVARPPLKRATFTGEKGRITWHCRSNQDCVEVEQGETRQFFDFPKKRSDDFLPQVQYVEAIVKGQATGAENSFLLGLEVMDVIDAAYRAQATGQTQALEAQDG